MKSRAVSRLVAGVFALGLATIGVAHAHAQANSAVQIDYLTVQGTALTIVGKNFGSAPAVFVADQTTVLSHNTSTELVVAIPQLPKGVHVGKVVRDNDEGGTGFSTVKIK